MHMDVSPTSSVLQSSRQGFLVKTLNADHDTVELYKLETRTVIVPYSYRTSRMHDVSLTD